MNKVKIAICVPTTSLGGAETMAAQLAKALNKDLFDVSFITNHSLSKTRVLDIVTNDSNIKIYSLNEDAGMSLRARKKMMRILKQIKPDVIHTHLHSYPYVMTYAIKHHIPIIHTMHNMPIFESKKLGRIILKFLFKHKFAIPVGISNIISEQIKELYHVPSYTIYNPVDVSKFDIKKDKQKQFTFITIGRMSEQKNQQLLLKSFRILVNNYKNVKLIFVGDGVLKDDLLKLTNDLKLNDYIEYVGNVDDVENYLKIADAFVLSSIYEGLPMTILEAMAASLPIISTNVGGVKDIVTNNGILVKVDEKDLAKAMLSLIENEKLCNEFKNNSYENAKNYDLSKIVKEYEELYFLYLKKKVKNK